MSAELDYVVSRFIGDHRFHSTDPDERQKVYNKMSELYGSDNARVAFRKAVVLADSSN